MTMIVIICVVVIAVVIFGMYMSYNNRALALRKACTDQREILPGGGHALGTSSHFVPVHHANAIIDGDAQEYLLEDIFELPGCSFSPTRLAEGDSYKFIPITEKNHYINKVLKGK